MTFPSQLLHANGASSSRGRRHIAHPKNTPRGVQIPETTTLRLFIIAVTLVCLQLYAAQYFLNHSSGSVLSLATEDRNLRHQEVAIAALEARFDYTLAESLNTTDANGIDRLKLDDYECVGWKPTYKCNSEEVAGNIELLPCEEPITDQMSGYCVLRHQKTQELKQVMNMSCDSLRPGFTLKCSEFKEVLEHGAKVQIYTHDPGFTYDNCRKQFYEDQNVYALTTAPPKPVLDVNRQAIQSLKAKDAFFKRGLAFVAYGKVIESVYVAVRSLRALGCKLPIELWYAPVEIEAAHPLLKKLTSDFGVYLRELRDPTVSKFYTKNYAFYYSAFDEMLLMDADSFAVKDPTYLFDTPEFQQTGAIFWPDFWRPKKTIFNIQERSFIWEFLNLEFVNMFEQESGQVLINRRQHWKALNAMMYYASKASPHIERLGLAWGDKDLFRFAWMKTNSSFHMIRMPPGAAGEKFPDEEIFCGTTIAQHDPNHELIFLHRNQEKLSRENNRKIWSHVQQFRLDDVPMAKYRVRGARGGRYFPQYKECYGKDAKYSKNFVVTPIAELPWLELEDRLLSYLDEAIQIVPWNHTVLSSAAGDNTEER